MIIPRAIYYMDLKTPLVSFFKVLLGVDLRSSVAVRNFEDAMGRELDSSVVTLPNARYGLMRTLEFLNIGKGDGVLMTPINLPDMKTVIENTGAQLRFIKYRPKSFEPDFGAIEVDPRDKVLFFTPLAGIIPDMDKVQAFCDEHNLILVIDFTQSFLASFNGRGVHHYSDYSFSSLCDLKVIHTHRGGIYSTRNREFIEFLRNKENELRPIERKFFFMSILEDAFSLTLLKPRVFKFFTRWGLKLLALKRGDNVEAITSGQGIKILGFRFLKGFFQSNQVQRGKPFPSFLFYRFTDLQAKIGLNRLKKFKGLEKRRIHNAELFYKSLEGSAVKGIPGFIREGATYWKSPFWVNDAKGFKAFMAKWGVDCSQTNLPLLYNKEEEVERNMRDNIVYMPTHWYLNDQQVLGMATIVNEYFKGRDGE